MNQKEENKTVGCVNCQKAVGLIQVILDEEATGEQKSFFSSHLDKCKDCLSHYLEEKNLLETIKKKLERKQCPSDLLKKIKSIVLKSDS